MKWKKNVVGAVCPVETFITINTFFFFHTFTAVTLICRRKAYFCGASQEVLVVKNPSANAGDVGDVDSICGNRRFPREGNGNPLQYSCLENLTDRRVWWATVHRLQRVGHD